MNILRLRVLFLAIACLVLMSVGCGPKAALTPSFRVPPSRLIAILPPEYPAGISRERVDYLHELLRLELENSDWLVLSEEVITEICSSPECTERTVLGNQYDVSQFAKLEIETISQTDFVAGYYNTLKGSLEISDLEEQQLALVEHQESERGGLVFESGQVLEGLLEQYENSVGERFGILAVKFTRTLIDELPRPTSGEDSIFATQPEIQSLNSKTLSTSATEICVRGTSNSFAYLILDRQRATLRSNGHGSYCGVFNPAAPPLAGSSSVRVELRSAYGLSDSEMLSSMNQAACEIEDNVYVESKVDSRKVIIDCSNETSCPPDATPCVHPRFIVYRANSPQGPFLKAAETEKKEWIDPAPRRSPIFYQIIAIDGRGLQSLPVLAKQRKVNGA